MSNSRHEPTEEDLRGAPVLPGFELPDSVTLGRGVVHADALQPEDVGVLAWLKLRDPRKPAKQEDLAKEMQAQGWKMGKGRFAAIFQRLKAAGHIKHHCPYNPETGRPEWRIEFFMNPANNDQYVNSGISAFPQAGAGFPKTGDPQTEQRFENPETGVSPGQKGFPVFGDPLPDSQKPGIPSGAVPAGQSRNLENPVFGSSPPHPPEGEVGTTSPSPHKPAAAPRRDKRATTPEVDPKATAEAVKFLMKLPGDWAVGLQRAQSLAPWLVQNAELTGWQLDISLRMYLTRPEPGKKQPDNYGAVLGYRIKDMQTRESVIQAAADAEQGADEKAPQPSGTPGLPDWCTECDSPDYRWIAPESGPAKRCPACHPAEVARRNRADA